MSEPESQVWPQSVWPDRLALALLALVAAIVAMTFRDYGLGWDDLTHAQYGERLLALYSSGFRDTRALSFVNLYLYGGGFDMAGAALSKILPFDLFETRRLLGAAVGLVGLFATWRIARRVGGPIAGLAALALLATCPLYYGHMFINPKDAPFAAAMAVLLLGLVRAFEQYPRPSLATTLILGLGLGLSLGSRIMAGFGVLDGLFALALVMVLEARAHGWRVAGAQLRRFAFALAPGLVVAAAVTAAIWPWVATGPLNLARAIGTFSHFFETPWKELFEGALFTPPDMPRSYVPVLLALKLPGIFLLLAGAGLIGTLVVSARSAIAPRRRAIHLCIALAAILPVAVAVIARPAMYNGIRHFVFILPPLAVAGGLAVNYIVRHASRFHQAVPAAFALVFFVGVGLTVDAMVRLHPYQYVYFNAVSGGVRAAQSRYMLDYWGLAFKQAGQTLRNEITVRGAFMPDGRKWKIAVCGPHPPAANALGDRFELTWDSKGADFALMLGTFYCAHYDAPQWVQIVRDGVTFARVYDIRGRTVPELFTVPPVQRNIVGRSP